MRRWRSLLHVMIPLMAGVAMTACCSSHSPEASRSSNRSATSSKFSVVFKGIILHLAYPANAPTLQRAVIIDSTLLNPHYPYLSVDLPVDPDDQTKLKAALNKATGKIVHCDRTRCRVRIGGFAMRIRGDGMDDQPPVTQNPSLDPSYTCLYPHMARDPINATTPRFDILNRPGPHLGALPPGGAVGYFETEGGYLEATALEDPAYFVSDVEKCVACGHDEVTCKSKNCHEFMDAVIWSGATTGRAVLQIASNATNRAWTDIPTSNAGQLTLYVQNLATNHHPSTMHFALNERMLHGVTLPVIELCVKPYQACPGAAGFENFNAIPGCSNSAWP